MYYFILSTLFFLILGKKILDNIAEAFSPKSSPTKDRDSSHGDKTSRSDSKENLATPSSLEVPEKKPAGRGRGRHRLYKDDTYISEPMEFKGDFVVCMKYIFKGIIKICMFFYLFCFNISNINEIYFLQESHRFGQ